MGTPDYGSGLVADHLAHAIALLILGGLFIIGFGLYEHYYAPHPLIPFRLMRNKTVIGCMLIALIHPMAGRIVSGYLNTFCQSQSFAYIGDMEPKLTIYSRRSCWS